ncbi:MAG: M3 family metallopeptidase [Bacteroidales bacterium]
MTRRIPALLVVAAFIVLALAPRQEVQAERQAPQAANPFFTASTLPYQAPPFDRIKDGDFQPAIEQGMKRQRAEIDAIANDPSSPTFANTIEAMEKSGALLTRVSKVFFNLAESNTNPTLQKVESEEAPKLAAHQDAIFMDPKLFARVKAIYDAQKGRAPSSSRVEASSLVERYYRNFVRAGALLSDGDKAALSKLNEEESRLTTDFKQRVLADTDASAVVVDDKAQLAGLTDQDTAAAAEAAKERKLDGKWLLRLENTTQQPILDRLQDRTLRARVFQASAARGTHGGPNDTKAIVERLAELRAQKAKLLGFPDYASYALDDQMARTPQAAERLMTSLVPASTAKAREEAGKMQRIVDAEKAGFQLGPQDWEFYAEKVRKAEYDLDESQIKPYLLLDRVVQDGIFLAANRMYGLSFKERRDIPVYNPDVRVWEVFDANGASMALYYGDYFARPNKSGGAWMDSFVDQSGLLGTKPVIVNVLNVTKPAAGQPALLTWDNTTTLFHEFGHALHGLLSNVTYPTLAGTNVPRDFVEFPSQFNEHAALDPVVLANYAKHYQTGAPMPAALIEKIRKTHTFNQGYMMTEYLAAALLDMAWHTVAPGRSIENVDAFEPAALKRFAIDLPQVPPRYHTTYFSHIWSGGYAAGYYAYLWSEVLAHDAYYFLEQQGGLTRENGQRLRDTVLSRGGSMPADLMYRAFRGRDAEIEPLLIERGLKAPGSSRH